MSHASFSGHYSAVSPSPGRSGWVPIYEVKVPTKQIADYNTGPRNRAGLIVVNFSKYFDPLSAKLLAMRDSGELFESVSIEDDEVFGKGKRSHGKLWGYYLRNVKIIGWEGRIFGDKPGEAVALQAESWGELQVKRSHGYQAGESTLGVMRRNQ